jgi:hypothetical protein
MCLNNETPIDGQIQSLTDKLPAIPIVIDANDAKF